MSPLSLFDRARLWLLIGIAALAPRLAADVGNLPNEAWAKLPPHPRLLANAARWQALKQQIRADATSAQIFALVRANAESFLTAPPVAYVDTGAFLHGPMRQGQGRILALALAYRIDGDLRFLAQARAEMKAMAALPNWYPQHFLDTGEAALGMGLGLDWLHDDLTPAERDQFAAAIIEKGLRASWNADGTSPKWATANTNWNQVCHGGLVVGALAVAEREPALARRIVDRALENVRHAAAEYAPGGAYPEGPSYWAYGTSFQVILVEALRSVFGTSCDLEKFSGFLASPDFVAQMTGPTGEVFNYADAHGTGRSFDAVMFWFARERTRPDLLATELASLQRWQGELKAGAKVPSADRHLPLALLYWQPSLGASAKPAAPPFAWSSGGGIQPVAAMRSAWGDPRATFVAFKGGLMPNSHAHMDVGSFVLEADGVRWAVDLGAESYPKARANGIKNEELFDTRTQASKRWWIFRKGPEGHNLLRFDGAQQEIDGKAEIIPATKKTGAPAYIVDLTSIYKRQVRAARRGFALLPDHRVGIQDEWTAADRATEVTWQWLTRAQAKAEADGLTLTQSGETLRLRVSATDKFTIALEDVSRPRQAFDSPNPGLSRFVIRLTTPANHEGRLVVVAEPSTVGAKLAAPAMVPLSQWEK